MKPSGRFISLLISAVLFFSICSCAETPTEDVVVNKGDNTIGEIIESSGGAKLEPDSDFSSDYSFKSADGKVTFNINTKTEIPDFDSIPILRVTPHYFTSEEIERVAKALFPDTPIYEYTEVLTKDQLQKMILQEKQNIPTKEYLLEYYEGNEDFAAEYLKMVDERIAAMEADYQTAPDEAVLIPSDFEYHPDSYYTNEGSGEYLNSTSIGGTMSVKLTATVDGIPYFMWVTKRDDTSHRTSNLYMLPHDITDAQREIEYYQTTELTETEIEYAYEIVNKFLDDMNLGDWTIAKHRLSSGETPRGKFTYDISFECVPLFNSFPLLNANVLGGYTTQYSPTYLNTYLWITVSNNRIMAVTFESPVDVVEEAYSDVPLLSYDDVFDKICKQLELTCSAGNIGSKFFADTGVKVTSASVNVTDITVSFIRTRIKDNDEDFYFIPAWTVYGYYTVHETESNGEITSAPAQDTEQKSVALFSINAVDGSVINLTQGY